MIRFSIQDSQGRQQFVYSADPEEEVRAALLEIGVNVQSSAPLPEDRWFSTDRDGVMLTLEEGDVEFPEPIATTDTGVSIWGSESAQSMLTDAGVAEGYRQYAVGLDKQAAEAMGEEFYPGDAVVIRRALLSSIERLRYVARKSHDANAEQALHRQIEEIGQTLIRFDVANPGAKLAI